METTTTPTDPLAELQREAIKTACADAVREAVLDVQLYTSDEAARLLCLPVARFRKLAKSVSTISMGTGKNRHYTLRQLRDLVKRHELPPMAG